MNALNRVDNTAGRVPLTEDNSCVPVKSSRNLANKHHFFTRTSALNAISKKAVKTVLLRTGFEKLISPQKVFHLSSSEQTHTWVSWKITTSCQ